jgi:hypothetical protein
LIERLKNFKLKKLIDLRVVEWIWAAAWMPWIIIFLAYSVSLLFYPYDWEPGEGSKILYAQRIVQGEPLYGTNAEFPMLGNCYPPVYPLAVAPLVALFGPHMWTGRLISLLAILSIMFGIYRVTRELIGSRSWAIVAVACFVFPAPLASWYPLARMDSLCSALLFWAAFAVFRDRGDTLKWTITAAVLSVLALYTKQTAVFVTAFLAVYYAGYRQWRKLGVYSATVFGAGIVLFTLFQLLSGNWFYVNLFAENTERVFFFQRYLMFFGWLFSLNSWVWIFSVTALMWHFFFRRFTVWHFYAIGGLINALLIGANGSGYNYFITFWSALSLLCPQGLAFMESYYFPNWLEKKNLFKLLLSLMLLFVMSINGSGGRIGLVYRDTLLSFIPSKSDRIAMRRIEEAIAQTEGDIFVDRLPGITVRYDKSQYYMEPAFIQELYHAGRWNPQPFEDMIAQKKFSTIFLLTESLVPSPVRAAVERNYSLTRRLKIPTFEVWRERFLLVFENPDKKKARILRKSNL